jgi:hypothetical protein
LKIGKNGVREDLMVPLDVNKLFSKVCQMQPITLTIFTNEKPLETNTQCVSKGSTKLGTLFSHTHLFPQNFVLPNLVTLKTPGDHHHPPITNSYFYCKIVTL